LEGHFEDQYSLKNLRTDFLLNIHFKYLQKSKHKNINDLASKLYYLPYELNNKNPVFSLQTNEYLQISYFRENHSYINLMMDSSFDKDTGKKLTVMIFSFPKSLEVN
jgi:hypothetical protein